MDNLSVKKLKLAKKLSKISKLITITSACFFIIFIALKLFGIENDILNAAALGVALGAIIVNLDLKFTSQTITKNDLIEIIEKQINSDADALTKNA